MHRGRLRLALVSCAAALARPWGMAIFGAVALTAIFVMKTGLITGPDGWYSADVAYRLVTDALMRGELALTDNPARHGHDWAWYNGHGYHAWGFGVPFLRLPFELIARIFDSEFPDRVVLVLLYFLVLMLVLRFPPLLSRRAANGKCSLASIGVRLSCALLLLFSPQIQDLAGTVFSVYEEAVLYRHLWDVGAFTLVVLVAQRATTPLPIVAAAFCAGYSTLIRATGAAHGLATLTLLLFLARSRFPIRVLGYAVAAFAVAGPLPTLVFNQLRFHDFLNPGHSITLTSLMSYVIINRFGGMYEWSSLWEQARDQFGSLFFIDDIKAWESPQWREHDIYFPSFGVVVLAISILVAVIIPAWVRYRRKLSSHALVTNSGAKIIWCCSLAVFFAFFMFYMRFAAVVSRYLSEFMFSIYLMWALAVALLLDVRVRTKKRSRLLIGAQALCVALVAAWSLGHEIAPHKAWLPPQSADYVRNHFQRWPIDQARLPAEYRCGQPGLAGGILYNASDWKYEGDCSVGVATQLFFDSLECLQITVASLHADDGRDPFPARLDQVRVKVRFEEWSLKRRSESGGVHTLVFCPKEVSKWTASEVVAIGWIAPRELTTVFAPNVKLLQAGSTTLNGPDHH